MHKEKNKNRAMMGPSSCVMKETFANGGSRALP
jgi:hypothetical protein